MKEPTNQDATQAGQIYFILNGDASFVKIGYSKDPDKRLLALETSNPKQLRILATIPGTEGDERLLHRMFDAYRGKGEWFHFAKPIQTFLRWLGWDGETK